MEKSLLQSHKGVSLVELLVASLVGTVVIYAAYTLLKVQTRAAADVTAKLNAGSYARQFLDLRRKALALSRVAPALLGAPNPLLPPAQQVWSGLRIARVVYNPDGTEVPFNETYQTACLPAPAGLVAIDATIHGCLACPANQLPVITNQSGAVLYPLGAREPQGIMAAALCVGQANGMTTMRLLSLVRKSDGTTMVDAQEAAVALPPAAQRFKVWR